MCPYHEDAKLLRQQCVPPSRSSELCAKALQIRIHSGSSVFFTTRVFPTHEVGTEDGWQYYYPVHEVRAKLLCQPSPCGNNNMPSL